MEPSRHVDPLEEALSQGSQRVAQFLSLMTAMRQMYLQRRAIHEALLSRQDDLTRRSLREQQQALREQTRLAYAPALDSEWLAHASFIQTARAWGGAAVFADSHPDASTALRRCEERLRTLHPYAMTQYDRFRSEGLSPLDAMRQTVPFFAHSPRTRTGDPAPIRAALTVEATAEVAEEVTAEPEADHHEEQQAEQRGQQIASRLQAEAMAAGRQPLGPDELAMVMETTTNLPETTIAKIAGGGQVPRVRGDKTAVEVAAESFPVTAADAVTASSTGQRKNPTQRATLDPATDTAKTSPRTP